MRKREYRMPAARTTKKKSYQARKNEGNNLFFLILHNILSDKSVEKMNEHFDDPTFDDVYTNVGVEKALSKCYDIGIVRKMVEIQITYRRITDKKLHYWYLMKALPKTFKSSIDWRIDG